MRVVDLKYGAVVLSVLVALQITIRSSLADQVLLQGPSSTGNGWLFEDAEGHCRVVTPAHVLQDGSNSMELAAPNMTELNRRVSATSEPVRVPDTSVDLAFLMAGSIVSGAGCSPARLSDAQNQELLLRSGTGTFSYISSLPLDREVIPIDIMASTVDEQGGQIFALKPPSHAKALKKTMSGGIIIVNGEPLGMLLSVTDKGVGRAIRFDAISRLYAATYAKYHSNRETQQRVQDIAVSVGQVVDGTLSALTSNSGSVKVAFAVGRVTLTLDVASSKSVSSVNIIAPEKERLGANTMVVEGALDLASYGYIRACEGVSFGSGIRCSFAPHKVSRLRVTLIPADVSKVASIRAVEVE